MAGYLAVARQRLRQIEAAAFSKEPPGAGLWFLLLARQAPAAAEAAAEAASRRLCAPDLAGALRRPAGADAYLWPAMPRTTRQRLLRLLLPASSFCAACSFCLASLLS